MLWIVAGTVVATGVVVVIGMNFLTPEKRLERRVEHSYNLEHPQFAREMGVVLGPAIVGGNQITALHNGDEVFPAMLDAIAAAEHSVTFETFIYWSGEVGGAFADAFIERAQAGVPVHVTVDWVGSLKMEDELFERMERAGVRIHRYRPLHWYNLGRMNNRSHRKLLIIDGRVGFTGGVGIADTWSGDAQSPDHWRDTHYRVDGPVVAQMQAAYTDNWIKMTGEMLSGTAYFPPLEPVGESPAQMFLASPAGGGESMHLMYLMTVAAAEHSIDLAASYFVPDDLLVQALVAACRRGVKVRILVPGPHIDSQSVRVASKRVWGPMLDAGAEIYVYLPTMLHTKLLVVDGLMVSVGSTNADLRSFRLNDEASLNIYDRDFAAAMTAVFEADLVPTERYTLERWQQRPWQERFAETVLIPIKSQL